MAEGGNKISFDLPEGYIVTNAVCVVTCLTEDQGMVLRAEATEGTTLWTQAEMYQAGADRARDQLAGLWDKKERGK